MPNKKSNVKNTKQYEALKDKGMSKERAAKIANSPRRFEPGRQGVRLLEREVELEAGRDDRAEEGRRPQGWPRLGPQILTDDLAGRLEPAKPGSPLA